MKITKNQLRRIIKEEKEKVLSEMNPDGTVSDDEEFLEEQLLQYVEIKINELIQYVRLESEKIGGGFRGPGIKARVYKQMANMLRGVAR